MTPTPFPTPATHPNLGWRRLASPDARFNYPFVVWTVVQNPTGGIYIYAFSERSRNTFERPCTEVNRAIARILDWAR